MDEKIEARRLKIAMITYPGMTLLDMAGPQTIWGFHADTFFVWEQKGPVTCDTGAVVIATNDFRDCPRDIDIVFVPGGSGTWDALSKEPLLGFLKEISQSARYVTAVCTGSILLAAAGLLTGKKAATHWAVYPLLEEFGVEAVRERVVIDGSTITGGGVTAGIDFGLVVLAELIGEEAAKTTQLMVEYDPSPPFDSGSPDRATPEVLALADAMTGPDFLTHALAAVQKAAEKMRKTVIPAG
ncbi:DJ-1/PfpI family protein [Qipengyuania flava]|uniref:DJ-1/PfpI family protein n=1 Tax=Qipengyuania flava TaxID=192812 RepID=UPI001CD3D10D|nr:DJ-1/PfpI family protein [Qipengyuania flava]MCA0891799.1 DJ-1/PfpI family protein [Qipengyuania flava]